MTMSMLPNPIAASSGSLLYAMRRDPLEFFTTLAREHGDMVRFRLGDHEHDLFLLNHPDYIRDALVTQDRNFVSFMYSYPNMIPINADTARRIGAILEPLEFDRIYGAFWGRVVAANAKEAARQSVARYIKAIT